MNAFIQIPHRDQQHAWRFSDEHGIDCEVDGQKFCYINEIFFLSPIVQGDNIVDWRETDTIRAYDRVEFVTDLGRAVAERDCHREIGRIKKIIRNGFGFDPQVVIETAGKERMYSILAINKKLPD